MHPCEAMQIHRIQPESQEMFSSGHIELFMYIDIYNTHTVSRKEMCALRKKIFACMVHVCSGKAGQPRDTQQLVASDHIPLCLPTL
jgi:hypothetical protein